MSKMLDPLSTLISEYCYCIKSCYVCSKHE